MSAAEMTQTSRTFVPYPFAPHAPAPSVPPHICPGRKVACPDCGQEFYPWQPTPVWYSSPSYPCAISRSF